MMSDGDVRSQIQTILSKVDALTRKIDKLEGKIGHVEAVISNSQSDDLGSADDIYIRLAKHVTTIAGLQEAVSSKIKPLKLFWSCMLIIGISATVFYIYETVGQYLQFRTASNIRYEKNTTYKYPPMLLCPDSWLDDSKIRAFGLSPDAIKYSLAYYDDYHFFQVKDVASARQEFAQFYNNHNFTSLIDFYKSISVDLTKSESAEEFAVLQTSAYHCGLPCEDMEKVYLSGVGMCNSLSMADAHGAIASLTWNNIYAKVKIDPGKAYFDHYSAWYLYFSRDGDTDAYTKNNIFLSPFKYTMVKVSAKKFISIQGRGTNDCVSSSDDPFYSPANCLTTCREELRKAKFKCIMWLATNTTGRPLEDFCNFLDPLGNTTLIRYAFSADLYEFHYKVSSDCSEKCPEKCERVLYDISVGNEFDLADADYDQLMHKMHAVNMSFVVVNVVHSAIHEGGIMTFMDVNTYSFIELVNNVGGTLGLFVGGTVMTLIQFIVFLVVLIFERAQGRQK